MVSYISFRAAVPSSSSKFAARSSKRIGSILRPGVRFCGSATQIDVARDREQLLFPFGSRPEAMLDEHGRTIAAMYRVPDGEDGRQLRARRRRDRAARARRRVRGRTRAPEI